MFELDFSERFTGIRTPLARGKTLLKRLQEGIHQRSDDHYEVPLPLRDGMLSITNNNFLALRWFHKLGQKIEDDMKYRDEYTTFMKESLPSSTIFDILQSVQLIRQMAGKHIHGLDFDNQVVHN